MTFALKMEVIGFSETSITIYHAAWYDHSL
jgi:hypothetical protein